MVEVIAAVGGAMMTACFVSVGSVSYRGRQSRDDLVRNTTAIELLTTKIDDMHDDMKEVFHRLKEGLDDKEEQLAVISLFVRLGVVVWSGFIVTLNYISIPGYSSEPKDITFPASLLTGALATFGLEGSKKSSKKDDKVAQNEGMIQTIRVITPIKIEGAEVIDPKPKK